MKKLILSLLTIFTISIFGIQAQSVTQTIGVRGNCGMCKKTIETAAKSVDGVEKALWNMEKKYIEVTFNTSKTTMETIEKAIALKGYDTENVTADKKAYKNLHHCCQYDRTMQMNRS